MPEIDYNNWVEQNNGITDYTYPDVETNFEQEAEEGERAAQKGLSKDICKYKGMKRKLWITGYETVCLDGEFGILNYIDPNGNRPR